MNPIAHLPPIEGNAVCLNGKYISERGVNIMSDAVQHGRYKEKECQVKHGDLKRARVTFLVLGTISSIVGCFNFCGGISYAFRSKVYVILSEYFYLRKITPSNSDMLLFTGMIFTVLGILFFAAALKVTIEMKKGTTGRAVRALI